jgi:sugar lactone lactonase YvrE
MTPRLPLAASAAALLLFASPVLAQAVIPAEVVARFLERPGNPAVGPDGRILVSVHPLDHPGTRIVELGPDGAARPYPEAPLVSGSEAEIKAVIAIRIDDDGIAWILDLSAHALIAWDLKAERLVRTLVIPDDVLVPTSFLQDFALDQKRGRAIIADMTQGDLTSAPHPAFITVDLATGDARRVAQDHPSMMPETEGGLALNGITIDPDYEWVYFGAVHSRSLYRVRAEAFDAAAGWVASGVERYAAKPFSDGITIDGAANVYVTDIEHHAIGVSTPAGYRIIASLDETQSWPDGFSFGPDGYVYATVNQLDRSAALNDGVDTGRRPFLLVRFPALARGVTGR